jgi:hypothetical protein
MQNGYRQHEFRFSCQLSGSELLRAGFLTGFGCLDRQRTMGFAA